MRISSILDVLSLLLVKQIFSGSQVRVFCLAEEKIFACACVPIPPSFACIWKYMKFNIKSSMNQPLTPLKWES